MPAKPYLLNGITVVDVNGVPTPVDPNTVLFNNRSRGGAPTASKTYMMGDVKVYDVPTEAGMVPYSTKTNQPFRPDQYGRDIYQLNGMDVVDVNGVPTYANTNEPLRVGPQGKPLSRFTEMLLDDSQNAVDTEVISRNEEPAVQPLPPKAPMMSAGDELVRIVEPQIGPEERKNMMLSASSAIDGMKAYEDALGLLYSGGYYLKLPEGGTIKVGDDGARAYKDGSITKQQLFEDALAVESGAQDEYGTFAVLDSGDAMDGGGDLPVNVNLDEEYIPYYSDTPSMTIIEQVNPNRFR